MYACGLLQWWAKGKQLLYSPYRSDTNIFIILVKWDNQYQMLILLFNINSLINLVVDFWGVNVTQILPMD